MNLAHARNSGPATSHQAATDNARRRKIQVNTVVRALKRHPGATSKELAHIEGLDRHVVARRLPDAERAGLVIRGDARKCDVGGRSAVTWEAVA